MGGVMAAQVQLDFFETKPIDIQFKEADDALALKFAEKAYKMCDNVRKGLFARDNKQDARIKELEERLAILERNICQTI